MPGKVDPEVLAGIKERNERITQLFQKKEDLHPDLVPHVDKSGPPELWMIKHPLVHTTLYPNAVLNFFYREALSRLAEAEKVGDWVKWVLVHEAPYQVEKLAEIANRIGDIEYWETVGHIYTSVENLWQYQRELRRLLTAKRPHRERLMTPGERRVLARMPDEITIHRGYGVARCRLGWSWTTDRKKARWFAERFAVLDHVKPHVISGTVSRGDVIAYFARRMEKEIVCDPKRVQLEP